jgi:predicted permease
MLSRLKTAMRAILRRAQAERELDEELRYHIEQQTEQNIRLGMDREEARTAARKAFGGVEQAKERSRDARGVRWLEDLWQDMRYGARMLVKKPGFTLIAVITLALGIGVNTALFTIYNAFVLKPLPIDDPQSIVTMRGVGPDGSNWRVFSYTDYLDYRDRNTTLESVALLNKLTIALGEAPGGSADLGVIASDGFVGAQIVSANYFSVLRAEMALGRGFLPEEELEPLTHPVVVLSHKFWLRHFNGDAKIIGKTIRLQGQTFTIVGVTASDFIGTTPDTPACWVPLMMRDAVIPVGRWNYRRWLTERSALSFNMLGRLKPGVTLEQSRADLSLIARRLAEQYPEKDRVTGVMLRRSPGLFPLEPDDYRKLAPLPLAVVLVLMIACANVANLLLARGAARQKEISLRLALGASRWRVIRQLLTESLLLAGLGGLAGFLLSWWTLSVLYPVVMARAPVPAFMREAFVLNLEPDYRIFGFAFFASIVAGVAAGLAPALQASRPDLISALKDEGSTFGRTMSQSRLRSGLAVAQIAISLMLLLAAGLLARSMQQAQTVDTGMQTKNLFSIVTSLKAGADPAMLAQLRRLLGERLRALPGVQSVAQAQRQPSSGRPNSTWVTAPGQTSANGRPPRANYNFVSPEYLSTVGIPLISGRNFTAQEAASGAPVMVINAATARHFWPELKDPAVGIGKRLGIGAATLSEAKNILKTDSLSEDDVANFPSYEVIGIARDTRSGWVWEKDETYIYLPLRPDSAQGDYLLVNANGNPREVMADARRITESLDPRLLAGLQRTQDHLEIQIAPFRAMASIAGALGLLALLLASVGLYGVMSFIVTQRTREIGVRVALGARRADVTKLFLRQGLKLISLGVAMGLLGGAALSRLLAAVLIDLSPVDPLAFGGVAVLLTLVALMACWIPAWRATKVDPIVALRNE